MSALSMERRTVLVGMAQATLVAGITVPGVAGAVITARSALRAVGDVSRAGGRALETAARTTGCPFADPQGEIVRLFQGPARDWLASASREPVMGYTGWSDFLLVQDLAREAGHRLVLGRLIGAADPRDLIVPGRSALAAQSLLTTVCGPCRDGGVAWIIQ